jgi:shikimate dehydrogenase
VSEQHTYVVGLIGAGIGPSLSPALHEREAGKLGLRYVYRRVDLDVLGLEADDVGRLVRAAGELGFDGLNVTHPAKQAVVPHLDALSPEAEALGAVNTVVFTPDGTVGHNTDWPGFAESFARGLRDAATERVVLVGAGGAGAAVAHAALALGAAHRTVVDADEARAAALAGALASRYGASRAGHAAPDDLGAHLGTADGVIHATPTGMAEHPGLPFDADLLRPELWVAEVVYRPLETELLRHARALGCRTLDGGGMAVFQAADSMALFTGVQPDRERMLRHFAALVAREPALAEAT